MRDCVRAYAQFQQNPRSFRPRSPSDRHGLAHAQPGQESRSTVSSRWTGSVRCHSGCTITSRPLVITTNGLSGDTHSSSYQHTPLCSTYSYVFRLVGWSKRRRAAGLGGRKEHRSGVMSRLSFSKLPLLPPCHTYSDRFLYLHPPTTPFSQCIVVDSPKTDRARK